MKYRPCYTCVYKMVCGGAGNTKEHPCEGHKTSAQRKREMSVPARDLKVGDIVTMSYGGDYMVTGLKVVGNFIDVFFNGNDKARRMNAERLVVLK